MPLETLAVSLSLCHVPLVRAASSSSVGGAGARRELRVELPRLPRLVLRTEKSSMALRIADSKVRLLGTKDP